ncbi:Heavy metal-(Cd/Co/Hg/Pb/Zn)-translocating P-type ATPase [Sulfitobacter sp. EE-36]|nr:Heavy metal-(Cd/Co/Hg/Pb/Zn)-translocating P-type ATPase [Sulfitobacter sp. EE-36]
MADGSTAQREWRVTGMDCGTCAAKVRGAVERLPGVANVDVALMSERLRLTLDEGETSPEQIENAVRSIGFGISSKGAKVEKPKGGFILPDDAIIGAAAALPQDTTPEEASSAAWYQTAKGRLVLGSGALLAAAWASWLYLPAQVSHWGFVIATLIGLIPVARRAVAMARVGMPFTI